VLAVVGDLLEDIVVRLGGPINVASDTSAVITRRRGGSAATVAAVAAGLGAPVRFIGQVGQDPTGTGLVEGLAALGVDVNSVHRGGDTGTIVVLVDTGGERSMLTDRRSCLLLSDPQPWWLDNVTTLHVPLYSLVGPPLSDTSRTLIRWAQEREIRVSVDMSSVSLIESISRAEVLELIGSIGPAVVLANEIEAAAVGADLTAGAWLTVIKRGAKAALLFGSGSADPVEVPAKPLAKGADSTGAGDAFAAGFLTYVGPASEANAAPDDRPPLPGWLANPLAACNAGHRAAARLLSSR